MGLFKLQSRHLQPKSHPAIAAGTTACSGAIRSKRRAIIPGSRKNDCQKALLLDQQASGPVGHGTGAKVVGFGCAMVDYMACIPSFPEPDAKIRTEALEVHVGGNSTNSLTAAGRLGLRPTLITKVGTDVWGNHIVNELAADDIDTSLVQRGKSSSFVYVMVDQAAGTRTCLHTPGDELHPSEVTPELIASALDGAAVVYFDGRFPDAALLLAKAAKAAGVPIVVEGERMRPGLEQLLPFADYLVTSAHFPQEWTGEQCLGDAVLAVAARLPGARMITTTRGPQGAVSLVRQENELQVVGPERCLQSVIDQLSSLAESNKAGMCSSSSSSNSNGSSNGTNYSNSINHSSNGNGSSNRNGSSNGNRGHPKAVCVSSSGVNIQPSHVISSPPLSLQYTHSSTNGRFCHQLAVATAAAVTEGHVHVSPKENRQRQQQHQQHLSQQVDSVNAAVFVSSAAALPKEAVVDTTGAGDAFIGALLYGIATGLPTHKMLQLASAVAACSCTVIGARAGLPNRSQLAAELLQPASLLVAKSR